MQENTKKYIQDLLYYLEIELNTIKAELEIAIKARSKLQKVFSKISENSSLKNNI